VVGGTSAGAPQWAGLIAEADQGRALVGLLPLDGPSQTLPAIYAFSSAFHDVTSGSNGYSAGWGYDLATGLGTPIAYVLAGDLAFHVNWNYNASLANMTASVSPHSATADVESAAPAAPSQFLRLGPGLGETGITSTANSSHARISARPVVVNSPLASRLPAQISALDSGQDRHDRAVDSLLEDRFAFLMS
jgi:hypothetical protein